MWYPAQMGIVHAIWDHSGGVSRASLKLACGLGCIATEVLALLEPV